MNRPKDMALMRFDLPDALAPRIILVLSTLTPLIAGALCSFFKEPLPGIIENSVLWLKERKFSTEYLISISSDVILGKYSDFFTSCCKGAIIFLNIFGTSLWSSYQITCTPKSHNWDSIVLRCNLFFSISQVWIRILVLRKRNDDFHDHFPYSRCPTTASNLVPDYYCYRMKNRVCSITT